MANFTGISGLSPEVRDVFLERVRREQDPFERLSHGDSKFRTTSLLWSAPPAASISAGPAAQGSEFTIGRRGSTYWAGLHEDADGTVTLETDLLGLFPVYYWSTADRLVFSSSPAVFKFSPDFRPELSVEGLVGVLLVNFIVDGQTLLKGVRRLASGHKLEWKKGSEAKEIRSESIAPSDRYFGNSFEKNLEIIDGLFTAAVEKDKRDEEPLVLLSGGLDSRLLAGTLNKVYGKRVRAVTQGTLGDFELDCARKVARALRWPQDVYTPDPGTFEHYARLKLQHEHLSHGFNTPYFMQLVSKLKPFNTLVYTGVHGDAALGCGTMSRAFDPKGDYPFETYLAHLNHSGLSMECIRRLVPENLLKTALEDVPQKLRALYNSTPGRPFQRAWLYELAIADRLQVGFIPRMLAFGSWPVLPFVDKALLTAVAGMPYDHIAHRRMEKEIVCRKYPALAVLPLDRNNYNTSPVLGLKQALRERGLSLPQAWTLVSEYTRGRCREKVQSLRSKGGKTDRRFYYQTFDVNSPAWRAFRKEAEGSREAMEKLFNRGTLSELWPGASETVRVKNGITDTQALKVLLGFAVWSKINI